MTDQNPLDVTEHPLLLEADREQARSLRAIIGSAVVAIAVVAIGVVFVELLDGPRWIIGLVYASEVVCVAYMFRSLWRFATAVELLRRL